jgi:hypothetical protein
MSLTEIPCSLRGFFPAMRRGFQPERLAALSPWATPWDQRLLVIFSLKG